MPNAAPAHDYMLHVLGGKRAVSEKEEAGTQADTHERETTKKESDGAVKPAMTHSVMWEKEKTEISNAYQ